MFSNTLNPIRCILLVVFIRLAGFCFGQTGQLNKIDQFNSISLISIGLDSVFESDFLLKNGRVFIFEFPRAKGYPFFLTNEWTNGNLTINGKLYHNIPLLFDSFHDQLICMVKNRKAESVFVKLNSQCVNMFNIGEHLFVNCNSQPDLPQHGFYEVIYENISLNVFAKWAKKYLDSNTLQYSGIFDEKKPIYYLLKEGKVEIIHSNRDFKGIYRGEKSEIKSFMRKNNIKFFRSNQKELSKLFQFCKDFTLTN
jgi:hypothetical protein